MSTFKTLQTEKSYNSLKENKIDSDYTELNSLIEQNNEFEKQNITLKEEIKQIKKEKRKINKSIDNFVTKIWMTASVKLKEKTIHYKRVQTLTQYSIKALK